MSERTVKVTCDDKCMRMQLELQSFDDFKENLSRRLNLGTEQISVKAIVTGNETEYDVTNDDDLHDLWNDLVELRITRSTILNPTERLDPNTVEINGVSYCLDVPMAEDNPIVEEKIAEYRLDDFISQTKAMTAVVGLSYIATVASGESKLINGMHAVCFSTRRICGDTMLLMSEYERTCSLVLETFQRMILYTKENNRERAMMSFAKIGEFVKKSCDDTGFLIWRIEKTLKEITEFTEKISGVESKTQKKLEEDTEKMRECKRKLEYREKEEKEIELAMDETKKREDVRKAKAAKIDKKTSVAAAVGTTGVVGSRAAVRLASVGAAALEGAALVGTAGTVAAVGVAGALVAAPIFLLVAVGGGMVFTASKEEKVSIEKEGEKNLEQTWLQGNEKINVEQNRRELDARLDELSLEVEPAKNLRYCLQTAQRYISDMNMGLLDLQIGWKNINSICEAMDKNQEMRQNLKEDCSKILESRPFKFEVVHYYARWVALKVFARRCNESLKAAKQTLEVRTTVDMTRQKAKESLRGAAADDDFPYVNHPGQCKDHND